MSNLRDYFIQKIEDALGKSIVEAEKEQNILVKK